MVISGSSVHDPTPDERAELQSGFRSRMVHAHGWPFGTTEAAVRTAFPAALCVKLEDDEGRYQRRASMVFPTTEGAKGAAGNGMTVDGLRLVLKWGGVTLLCGLKAHGK